MYDLLQIANKSPIALLQEILTISLLFREKFALTGKILNSP